MRVGLWMGAACAAALLAGCGGRSEKPPTKEEAVVAPAAEAVAEPAAAVAPEPPKAEPPKPAPLDAQIAEDAAAVGMTTREPLSQDPTAPSEPK